jgi:predicted HD phosphohydrolase
MRRAEDDGLCPPCRNERRGEINKRREIEKFLRQLFKEEALEKTIAYDQDNKYHDDTLDRHLIKTYLNVLSENDYILSWSALLHDIGKPSVAWQDKEGRRRYYKNPSDPASLDHATAGSFLARGILERYGLLEADIDEILYLIEHHGYSEDQDASKAKERNLSKRAGRFLKKHGRERSLRLLRLREADWEGDNRADASAFRDAVLQIIKREEA